MEQGIAQALDGSQSQHHVTLIVLLKLEPLGTGQAPGGGSSLDFRHQAQGEALPAGLEPGEEALREIAQEGVQGLQGPVRLVCRGGAGKAVVPGLNGQGLVTDADIQAIGGFQLVCPGPAAGGLLGRGHIVIGHQAACFTLGREGIIVPAEDEPSGIRAVGQQIELAVSGDAAQLCLIDTGEGHFAAADPGGQKIQAQGHTGIAGIPGDGGGELRQKSQACFSGPGHQTLRLCSQEHDPGKGSGAGPQGDPLRQSGGILGAQGLFYGLAVLGADQQGVFRPVGVRQIHKQGLAVFQAPDGAGSHRHIVPQPPLGTQLRVQQV